MHITLINFATEEFIVSRFYNSWSARLFGGINEVYSYNSKDLVVGFELNQRQKKGFGNYFWKPDIILDALGRIKTGEYLFYCDSGAFIRKDLRPLLHIMESHNQSILPFQTPYKERNWTKRDTFVLMKCEDDYYYNSYQNLGGYILIKKDDFALSFFKEFKSYC